MQVAAVPEGLIAEAAQAAWERDRLQGKAVPKVGTSNTRGANRDVNVSVPVGLDRARWAIAAIIRIVPRSCAKHRPSCRAAKVAAVILPAYRACHAIRVVVAITLTFAQGAAEWAVAPIAIPAVLGCCCAARKCDQQPEKHSHPTAPWLRLRRQEAIALETDCYEEHCSEFSKPQVGCL